MSSLTIETLYEAQRRMDAIMRGSRPARGLSTNIIFSDNCLKETTERLFPVSKNRSRRIHKKLVKRHGGEFRKAPAIFQTKDGIFCHPAFRDQLHSALTASKDRPEG